MGPEAGSTDEKKRGVRSEAAFKRRKKESVKLGQVGLRRARAQGQQGGAADTDQQWTEEHGNATQQGNSSGATEDQADGNG